MIYTLWDKGACKMKNNLEKDLLILPLQFFADGGGAGADVPEGTPKDEGKKDEDKDKTFTQSDLDSAISKAVASHSKKKDAEFQKLLDKAINEGIAKGKSYAELTDEQKKEADLAAREKAIQDKESELLTRERLTAITTDLAEAKLPKTFAKLLVLESDDKEVKTMIADFKKEYEEAINLGIKESLRQDTPQGDSKGRNKTKSLGEIAAEERNKSSNMPFDPWNPTQK